MGGEEDTPKEGAKESAPFQGACFSHLAISGQFVRATAAAPCFSLYFADSLW